MNASYCLARALTFCLLVEDLRKFNRNKQKVKALAKQYDAFIASSTLIRQVPRLLGPTLNKIGKFPSALTPNEKVPAKITELQSTIKFQLKFKAGMPMALACAIGNVNMSQ